MSEIIATNRFQATVDYLQLSVDELNSNINTAKKAFEHFYSLWQDAVTERFGRDEAIQLTEKVYPTLDKHGGDLDKVFLDDLNFIWQIIPHAPQLLTFATLVGNALPESLTDENVRALTSQSDLVLVWNLCTLAYVMQTSRWVETLYKTSSREIALQLEKEVWVDRGGAEDDLRYGLVAAGGEKGNVETLFRGFQFAPGEVGLVDAEFHLSNRNHGTIVHRRCPAHDRFRDIDKQRLENSCVICVIAMRLSGEMVNEKIRCSPASLPPHMKNEDHACKWEYWVEQV